MPARIPGTQFILLHHPLGIHAISLFAVAVSAAHAEPCRQRDAFHGD